MTTYTPPTPTYTPPTPAELRALLAQWDVSQVAAAALLNVDPRTVRRWVRGEQSMSYASLYALFCRVDSWGPEPESWRDTLLATTETAT